jgi:hypothetical protein
MVSVSRKLTCLENGGVRMLSDLNRYVEQLLFRFLLFASEILYAISLSRSLSLLRMHRGNVRCRQVNAHHELSKIFLCWDDEDPEFVPIFTWATY